MTAEVMRPRRAEVRPNLAQMRERMMRGTNVHAVIGSVLEADARMIKALSSPGVKATGPINEEFFRLYELPQPDKGLSDMLSEDFVSGFFFVTGLYDSVATVSQRLQGIRSRNALTKELSKSPRLVEPAPPELITSFVNDPSGKTWLDERVQEAFSGNTSESEVNGAKTAILGTRKLFDELMDLTF